MKGFLIALCIFFLWSAACIYYVSASELGLTGTFIEKITLSNKSTSDPLEITESSASEGINVKRESTSIKEPADTLSRRIENSRFSNISRTESKLLADEMMKSFAISDTIDITLDEPELTSESNVEISSKPATLTKIFYPTYKNSELIIDQELVAYAQELRDFLEENSNKRVTIIGHTDNVGNADDNFSIGLKKARQVKWYLTTRRGIPRKYIKAISRGEKDPLETNTSKWGRKKNNRVQIIVD